MAERPNQTVSVNVGALSNALAVAIQQATASGPSNSATTSASGADHQECNSRVRPSANIVLPSFLKRKNVERSDESRSKRQKAVQCWDRDIICLPQESGTRFPYPRGKFRAWLGSHKLIGKIRLMSSMSVEEVKDEVRSVFKAAMGERTDFPFDFLQPTGAGSRTLTVPSVSSSFSWTASQVSKLGQSKQSIYILAKDKLVTEYKENGSEDSDASYDSDRDEKESSKANEDMKEKQDLNGPAKSNVESNVEPKNTYKHYVDLIDLTGLSSPENLSDGSELDELPEVTVSLNSAGRTRHVPKCDQIASKHVLQQHQIKVITGADEEDYQRIYIRRNNLFCDALRAFSKPAFNVSKMLKVIFIGESSVDEGGPRREFFQLLMKEAFTSSGLFAGWPNNAVPIHNVEAVTSNRYYIVGKMIATCLVQGGQPPVCFAPAVADFLVYNEIRRDPNLDDVYDSSVRQKLEKINQIESVEDFRKEVESQLDLRFDCGFGKPVTKLELSEKKQLIKTIWLHYVYFLPHSELEQLRKGLRETLQLEIVFCIHSTEMYNFLVASSNFDVTPTYFLDSFAINYSNPGSYKHTAEEAIILHWNEFVVDSKCQIAELLQFITGSTKLPAAGFNATPTIKFTEECCLPRTSTCDISITFPRSFGHLSYEEFKDNMNMCIQNSYGFGQP